MFRTRSFYVTLVVSVVMVVCLFMLLAPSMNEMFDAAQEAAQGTAQEVGYHNGGLKVEMQVESGMAPCPVNICSEYTSFCMLLIVIFMSCFVGDFYKGGFCKNVISRTKHKYDFQIAKSACAAVYAAIVLAVTVITSLIMAKGMIHSFEMSYMGTFFEYLLGEYCLLVVIGLFSAFLTELSYSKIPSITYICLTSTNIVGLVVSGADKKLFEWLNRDIFVEDWFPTLYEPRFLLDAPASGNANTKALLHAVVLSLVFLVIYNAAGAALVSKRDVK